MSKNRKARLIEVVNGKRMHIVASANGEKFDVDSRSKRPIGVENGQDIAYMQEINRIEFDKKNNKQSNILSYFAPNNVGILLSIANKALINAKTIYEEKINPNKYKHNDILDGNTETELSEKTVIVYDFIEAIQTSVVFGYTAIEAFTNLSINEDYKYVNIVTSKGVTETYDKKAIERWLSLDVKISNILVDIYQCESIKKDKVWSKFKQFEECRNEIIHQKSINFNKFYEEYFNEEIFELCSVPTNVIKFFFEKSKERGSDNPLWPLVVNKINIIQIFSDSILDECVGIVKE